MATTVFELEASFGIDSTKFKEGIKQAMEEAEKMRKELNKTGQETNSLGKEVNKEGKEARNSAEDNKKLGKEVKEAGDSADGAKDKFSGLGDHLKGGFATAAKIGTAAIGAATAATAKFLKESISTYAEYEQLSGGIEAAFEGNQSAIDEVLETGSEAWSNLQMSANEYYQLFMSTYPLIKADIEDQNDAIATTNRLMQLEADLANTFGYDASTAANAISWALKGSYSYLDNLNIGIKGTKEGFLEAVNASGLFKDEIQDISELTPNQIVDVLESYASQYGVLGRTQEEGSKTIQGSINSAKAAWDDFKAELGKPAGDVDAAFENLSSAALTAADNIAPVAKTILSRAFKLAAEVGKEVAKDWWEGFKAEFTELAKSFKEKAKDLLNPFDDEDRETSGTHYRHSTTSEATTNAETGKVSYNARNQDILSKIDFLGGRKIDKNADGNYITTPRLSWVAEKEPEYIIPESKMDKVYKNNSSTINVTVNVEGGISSDYDVDRMVERLSERMSMLSEWQSRALGGAGLG